MASKSISSPPSAHSGQDHPPQATQEVISPQVHTEDSEDFTKRNVDAEKGSPPLLEPVMVDWDGAMDPANPRNWKNGRKWAVTIVVSLFTVISPISSSMIAPAALGVAQDLGIRNHTERALSISIFVLGYAFGPLLMGPLSEVYGRVRVLLLSNLFFFAWSLACGFAKTKAELIVFRFFAGFGGSAPFVIGGGVIADLFAPEKRGQAIAVYSLAPFLGPAIGPIVGAWIAEKTTWRWVFWAICIFDALIQILGNVVLKETYAPVLLERKAAALRISLAKDAEKGPIPEVKTSFEGANQHWRVVLMNALKRPLMLTIHEPIIQLLGAYMAFLYGIIYLYLTTIPSIFGPGGVYNQRTGISGLHYIALGIGLTLGAQGSARIMDRLYGYLCRTKGENGRGKPEFRLPCMFPGTILLPVGLLVTGWTVEEKTHWIGPDFGIFITGIGLIMTWLSIQIYIVDAFALHAASALAAVSVLRSFAGFGFPLFAPAMFDALGYGRGDSLLAGVAVLIGCPAPLWLWFFGERIRKASRHARK